MPTNDSLAAEGRVAQMTVESQLKTLLERLYREELRTNPREYIAYHSSPQAISARVNGFLAYSGAVPTSGRVLDWGCQHAADACMVRATRPDVQLDGCDFIPPGSYPVFWDYAGFKFTQLAHHASLPFESNTFDCVIGGGVLEHTAMDYECLKELYRVVKPGASLVLTHLPNKFSYTEFAAREIRKRDFHRKLYTVASISALLERAGFYPEMVRPHRFLPTNSLPWLTRRLSRYEPVIDRIWPLNVFCGDLMAIARKVEAF